MRVLINTVPFYGKGEGVRTYTAALLRTLHQTDADMEWHVLLDPADIDRLGLADDERFRLIKFAGPKRSPRIPGMRFAWRNAIDQAVMPAEGRHYSVIHYLDSYGPVLSPGNAPLVLTVHDLIPFTGGQHFTPWVRRYLQGLMRAGIPHAAAIMSDSEVTAQALHTVLGIAPEKITVVPLGVDERFRPATPEERARVTERYQLTAPYVICVGTIEPRKNLARVVRAFARAKREHSLPHHLLIVGKQGWGYDDVMAEIAKANLGPELRLLGFLPREDVPPLIAGADVLAHLSLEEGFGLPVVEGMACGAPVVTSSVSSLAEVAGDAGLLIEPTDEAAIGAALARVCRDEALRAKMRAASLTHARQYTWTRVGNATLDTYRKVVARASH